MADTFTLNFGLTKPEIGSSPDSWGNKLNSNLDSLDNIVVAVRSDFLPVDLATTGNVTLAGEQTVDGMLTSANRVLVWANTNAAENGIYVTGVGAWTRAKDANETVEFVTGRQVVVLGGTANGKKRLFLSSPVVSLGVSSVVFSDEAKFGALSTAGNASIAGTLTVAGTSSFAAITASGTIAASGAVSGAGGTTAQATTTTRGTLEVADQSEAEAWVSDFPAITPLRLKQSFSGSRVSTAANGFQQLPSGIIFQWGITTAISQNSGAQSFSFPMAFPNACLNAQATTVNSTAETSVNGDTIAQVVSVTSEAITLLQQGMTGADNSIARPIYWFAIGY